MVLVSRAVRGKESQHLGPVSRAVREQRAVRDTGRREDRPRSTQKSSECRDTDLAT